MHLLAYFFDVILFSSTCSSNLVTSRMKKKKDLCGLFAQRSCETLFRVILRRDTTISDNCKLGK